MVNPAYRPNISAETMFAEHTWLQGAFLAAVAYGMETILFMMSFYLLYTHRSSTQQTRDRVLMAYISVIFLLGTLYMAGLLQFTQEAFIDGRNIPGGPVEYEEVMFSIPIDMLANVVMVLITWFCDIINVWRCLVIYKGCRVPVWAVALVPGGMYLASFALGVLFLKQVGAPAQSPWDTTGVNFTIPYYAMSLSLNVLVTILIVARLLLYRRRITKALGKNYGTHYTSMAAMIIESAAIYSSFSILFLVPFAVGHPLSQLFLQALSPVQCVSTFLIIFRVAQGKGWSHTVITTTLTGGAIPRSGSSSNRMPLGKMQFRSNHPSQPTQTTQHSEFEHDNNNMTRTVAFSPSALTSDRSTDEYDLNVSPNKKEASNIV